MGIAYQYNGVGGQGSGNQTSYIKIEASGADLVVNRNTTTETTLALTGTEIDTTDGKITYNSSTGRFITSFSGVIELTYNLPLFSSGQRNSTRTTIIHAPSGQPLVRYGQSYSYIRAASGHNRDNNTNSAIINCSPNDQIFVLYRRAEGSTNTNATNLTEDPEITIKILETN